MTTNLNPMPERLLFYGAIALFLFCVVVFFSSCSVSRNVNRDIKESTLKTTNNEKTATNTNTNTNTRITEEFDGNVHFPGSKIAGMKPLEDLKRGDTLKTENNDVSSSVFLDQNGNIGITTTQKPKDVPVKGKKVTEQAKTEATAEQKQSSGTTAQNSKEKAVESQTKAKNNLPWLLLLIIPAIILIYVFRKRIPLIKNL